MENEILTVFIVFNEVDTKNTKTGYLSIKSTESLHIDRIKGHVFFEVRGRMTGEKKSIVSVKIDNPPIIKKNEVYEVPFTIELPDDLRTPYKGTNVKMSYSLQVQVFVNDNDMDKLDKSTFSKLKSFLTSDDSLKFTEYFEIKSLLKKGYKVEEVKSIFKIEPNLMIGIFLVILFGGIYFLFLQSFSSFYIFLGLFAVAVLTFLITRYIGSTLGEVSMEALNDDDVFLCKIRKTRKFNLTQQECYYEVIEKVVDKRGTSSSTYTEILHTSSFKELRKFKRTADLKFNYPIGLNLHSFKYKDVAVMWKMNLEGRYLGLKLKYKCEFMVEEA